VEVRWTVPNVLTVARMMMTATAAWLALATSSGAAAVWILIVAAWLDVFDGWYARRRGQSTSLGKHLDPFADKLLVAVILVWIGVDTASVVVWWLIGASLLREIAMTALRSYSARRQNRLIPAGTLGKVKMFLQCSGGLTILGVTHMLHRPVPVALVIAALSAMLVVSLAAMAGYRKAKGPAADHEQTHFALLTWLGW
jgi:CDP-diacylglycerol--glycerol-3-phosphate 3-phosphatidyltransferase